MSEYYLEKIDFTDSIAMMKKMRAELSSVERDMLLEHVRMKEQFVKSKEAIRDWTEDVNSSAYAEKMHQWNTEGNWLDQQNLFNMGTIAGNLMQGFRGGPLLKFPDTLVTLCTGYVPLVDEMLERIVEVMNGKSATFAGSSTAFALVMSDIYRRIPSCLAGGFRFTNTDMNREVRCVRYRILRKPVTVSGVEFPENLRSALGIMSPGADEILSGGGDILKSASATAEKNGTDVPMQEGSRDHPDSIEDVDPGVGTSAIPKRPEARLEESPNSMTPRNAKNDGGGEEKAVEIAEKPKRGRGRPKKVRRPGRPKKNKDEECIGQNSGGGFEEGAEHEFAESSSSDDNG